MEISEQTAAAIELCRRINRSAARQYEDRGIEKADVAIAAIYSAHDLAMDLHNGDPHAAIEWMRNATDIMERTLLEQARTTN
ncbi:hypothetical protein [Sphingobium sp.]|uniref:hypothetical protein n=1 Tax=Sphingobium sp. TaxID=1912891 RepID=UPI003BB61FAD